MCVCVCARAYVLNDLEDWSAYAVNNGQTLEFFDSTC
jgi:hypothetical protein